MKTAAIILGAVAALAVLAAGLAARSRPTSALTDERARLLAEFRARQRPAAELKGWPDFVPYGRELLDPDAALPHSQRYPFAEIAALYRYARSCAPPIPRSRALAKAIAWHRFRCRQGELPADFFSTPPFRHPSGASFVRLAIETGEHDRDWIARHSDRLGWGEWRLLQSYGIRLSSAQVLLGDLDSSQARAVFSGEAALLTAHHLWLRVQSAREIGYAIYPRAQWESFLAATPFRTVGWSPAARCLFREGNLCWQAEEPARRWEDSLEIVALVSAIALAGLGIAVAILRWRDRRRSEIARRFLLRTLVHELRTPVTNVQLGLETFRGDFDRLPDTSQETFLRLCDEMQRLRRVLAASTQYLQSRESASRIEFRPIELPSINAYFERISTGFSQSVDFRPLPSDRAFRMDAYWVGVCVKNLISNAVEHGRPPVRLTLGEPAGRGLRITVTDGGELRTSSLRRLSEAFHRRPDSPGLGLGLSIVREVVREMRGRLELTTDPTRFSILIPEVE